MPSCWGCGEEFKAYKFSFSYMPYMFKSNM